MFHGTFLMIFHYCEVTNELKNLNSKAWTNLFDASLDKIEIVSYHWGLQKGSKRGKRVFDALLNALDRNVSLNIVHTANKIKDDDGTDIQDLQGDSTSFG